MAEFASSKRQDMLVHSAEPLNAEPPRAALTSALTDERDCYVRNHGAVPEVDPRRWRLRVHGRLAEPLELSLHELRERFDEHEITATLQCAGNRRDGFNLVRELPGEAPWGPGATATAVWTGVRLSHVLAAAGVQAPEPGGRSEDAGHVAFEAPDVSAIATPPQRFGGSIPLPKAMRGEVLLAWAMNRAPLPAEHGAPVRVVVPGYIGARSVKWVDTVSVRDEPSDNYFQTTAYRLLPPEADPETAAGGLALGPFAVNSDILEPADAAVVEAGPATVRGYALAGDDRGIARVDVSLDDGRTWHQAELDRQLGPWAWRHWQLDCDFPPGPVTITARAWDTSAAVQPESAAQLWNPKGYVNNSWARVRITAR